MNEIKCVLHVKEFSVTDYGRTTDYVAIFPSNIPEDVVDNAIKRKFESLTEVEYKQIIIVTKEQYDTVLKPQMDILTEYNETIDILSMVSKNIRKKGD